jgi:hypothetical protein
MIAPLPAETAGFAHPTAKALADDLQRSGRQPVRSQRPLPGMCWLAGSETHHAVVLEAGAVVDVAQCRAAADLGINRYDAVAEGHVAAAVHRLDRGDGDLGFDLLDAPPAGGPVTFIERRIAHLGGA